MKKLLLILFATLTMCLFTVSCRSKEKHIYRDEEFKKVQDYSTADCINYMYEGCTRKKDFNALSRILQASPSSLERIRNGETFPTKQFESTVRIVTHEYIRNGCSIYELRKSYNDLKWYEMSYSKMVMISRIIDFILLPLLLFVFAGFSDESEKSNNVGCTYALLIGAVVLWLIFMGLRVMPQKVSDNFTNQIDRSVEFFIEQ